MGEVVRAVEVLLAGVSVFMFGAILIVAHLRRWEHRIREEGKKKRKET